MGRSCRPNGPVMAIDLRGELAEVEDRGREWAGSSRVTEEGMVRGAEPMWDCRQAVEEMHRREVAVPDNRLAVVRSIDVDAKGFMIELKSRC